MQEMKNPSTTAEIEANNVEELTPYIITANAAEFKSKLITPVHHNVFLACLKLALQHNAIEIIKILSRCDLTSGNEKKKSTKLTDQNAKTLLHLVSIQYAELFHTQQKMQKLFLDTIYSLRNKEVIFAAIKGEITYLKTIDEIPKLPHKSYHPVIVYAAANNQLATVCYLQKQQENPHELAYHRNAMVAAITCNATDVFDYLITTEFNPNMTLTVDWNWPCKFIHFDAHNLLTLSVICNHPEQFVKLVAKGAIITNTIVKLAVQAGADLIVLHCIENTPKLIDSSLMLTATRAGQLSTFQVLCDKTPILNKEPNFLQSCLEVAIQCGQALIVRFLRSKNISIATVDRDGLTPLFYAIEHKKLNIVKELATQAADILAVNNRGANAILIACQGNQHLEILEYLLTVEKVSETLNSDIYNNTNLLTFLCGNVRKFWLQDYNNQIIISSHVLECLLKHGIALFKSISIENSQERSFIFTYQEMVNKDFSAIKQPFDQGFLCVLYLNYFAVKQLLEMKEITLEYQAIANYLFEYYLKIKPLYTTLKLAPHLRNFYPDSSALTVCRNNLNALSIFKQDFKLPPPEKNQAPRFLCEAISTNFDNTCIILPTFLTSPIDILKLKNMLNSILLIPKGFIKNRLCIAMADRIISLTQNLDFALIIAIELYQIANEDNNADTQQKISTCIQTLSQLNQESDYNRIRLEKADYFKSMQPSLEEQQIFNAHFMISAIKYSNLMVLNYLESNGALFLIAPISNLIAIQHADSKPVFKYLEEKTTELLTERTPAITDLPIITLLIDTIQKSKFTTAQESNQKILLLQARKKYLLEMNKFLSLEQSHKLTIFKSLASAEINFFDTVRDKINELNNKNKVNITSYSLFNKLNLCLLVTRHPHAKILEFLTLLLNKLNGDITRRLLILSHICTYYTLEVKDPESTKTIFIRALAQLANIEFTENDSLQRLTHNQPKKLLIATLKIRLELVKLLTADYGELEQNIEQLINASSVDFLSIYHSCMQITSKVIHQLLTLQELSISTFYLDSIDRGCIVNLTHPMRFNLNIPKEPDPLEEDYSAIESGKRAANKEIDTSIPLKRNK